MPVDTDASRAKYVKSHKSDHIRESDQPRLWPHRANLHPATPNLHATPVGWYQNRSAIPSIVKLLHIVKFGNGGIFSQIERPYQPSGPL